MKWQDKKTRTSFILFHCDCECCLIYSGFDSTVSAHTSKPSLRGRSRNTSVQIIKFTDCQRKTSDGLWSASHSSGLHHKFLFSILFDIAVKPKRANPRWIWESISVAVQTELMYPPHKSSRKAQTEERSRVPYFRINFYSSQEKHLSDSSHTSRKVSVLSGCLCKQWRFCDHRGEGRRWASVWLYTILNLWYAPS